MDHNVTVLERAFQLANSGRCASLADLRRRLKVEDYSVAQIAGRELTRQLKALIKAARQGD